MEVETRIERFAKETVKQTCCWIARKGTCNFKRFILFYEKRVPLLSSQHVFLDLSFMAKSRGGEKVRRYITNYCNLSHDTVKIIIVQPATMKNDR